MTHFGVSCVGFFVVFDVIKLHLIPKLGGCVGFDLYMHKIAPKHVLMLRCKESQFLTPQLSDMF